MWCVSTKKVVMDIEVSHNFTIFIFFIIHNFINYEFHIIFLCHQIVFFCPFSVTCKMWEPFIVLRLCKIRWRLDMAMGSSSPISALFHPHIQSSLMKSCWFFQLNISVLIQTSLSSSGLHILLNLSIFIFNLKYCRIHATSLPVSGPFLFNPPIILLLTCFTFKHED